MYWQCLWMLNSGVDMFNQRTQALDDPCSYIEAYQFFTDHAGYKSARDSKTAWCTLRDGLDYLDTERFPEDKFGATQDGGNRSDPPTPIRTEGNPESPFLAQRGGHYYLFQQMEVCH
jgi:hypothetical protein